MKILFVCSANRDRSPTAEYAYRDTPGLEVKSAGTSSSAVRQVNEELLRWADVILCMEERHKKKIEEKFPDIASLKVIDYLDIRDDYSCKEPSLLDAIKKKTDAWLLAYVTLTVPLSPGC